MSRSQVLVILWLCALFPILILAGSVVAIAGTNEHFNMFKALLVSVSFPLLLIMPGLLVTSFSSRRSEATFRIWIICTAIVELLVMLLCIRMVSSNEFLVLGWKPDGLSILVVYGLACLLSLFRSLKGTQKPELRDVT